MNKKGSNNYKSFEIAKSNFTVWTRSSRTIFVFIFAALLVYNGALQNQNYMTAVAVPLHWLEAVCWALSERLPVYTYGLLMLIMINELPLKTGFHSFSLIRSDRHTWIKGQIFYCLWIVLLYVTFLILLTMFIMRFLFPVSFGWSEQNAIEAGLLFEEDALISPLLMRHFTPITGLLISILPIYSFYFMMSLLLLAFSISGHSALGAAVYMFLLLFGQIFLLEIFPLHRIPVQYAVLNGITGKTTEEIPAKLAEGIAVHIVGNILLLWVLLRRAKNTDLCF